MNSDAECAALTNFQSCRDHYYEYQNTADGLWGCNWNDNTCIYVGDRETPGGNPFDPDNVPPPNDSLTACLASQVPITSPASEGCMQYPGTVTSGKSSNDYATCYRINWRAVTTCKDLCLQLFSLNVDEYTWGYKVYDACTIGCGYQWRYTAWREQLALDNGLWNGDVAAQSEVRIRSDQKPDVFSLQEYKDNIDDYDCETQCQKTVWNLAEGNSRCAWQDGPGINVFEIADFGAVASCRLGCLMGNDPSMGALPNNREASNAEEVAIVYPGAPQ